VACVVHCAINKDSGRGHEHDEEQTVYRQALPSVGLWKASQLLERISEHLATEVPMDDMVPPDTVMATSAARAGWTRAHDLSTRDLVTDITRKVSLLVKKEVELARAEVKADFQAELSMITTMAAGAVAALLGLNGLLVAVIFAIAMKMPGWAAALIVGGAMLIIAGVLSFIGWSRRVTTPLAMTRKTLREDVQWAKERVA